MANLGSTISGEVFGPANTVNQAQGYVDVQNRNTQADVTEIASNTDDFRKVLEERLSEEKLPAKHQKEETAPKSEDPNHPEQSCHECQNPDSADKAEPSGPIASQETAQNSKPQTPSQTSLQSKAKPQVTEENTEPSTTASTEKLRVNQPDEIANALRNEQTTQAKNLGEQDTLKEIPKTKAQAQTTTGQEQQTLKTKLQPENITPQTQNKTPVARIDPANNKSEIPVHEHIEPEKLQTQAKNAQVENATVTVLVDAQANQTKTKSQITANHIDTEPQNHQAQLKNRINIPEPTQNSSSRNRFENLTNAKTDENTKTIAHNLQAQVRTNAADKTNATTQTPDITDTVKSNPQNQNRAAINDDTKPLNDIIPENAKVRTNSAKGKEQTSSNITSTAADVEPVAAANATQTPQAVVSAPKPAPMTASQGTESADNGLKTVAGPAEQVMQNIRMNLQSTEQRIQLTLNPPELGRVQIRFERSADEISGTLHVEKPQVRYEIERSLPEIIATLRDCGVQVRHVNVTSDAQNEPTQYRNNAPDDYQQAGRQESSDSQKNREQNHPDSPPAADTAAENAGRLNIQQRTNHITDNTINVYV